MPSQGFVSVDAKDFRGDGKEKVRFPIKRPASLHGNGPSGRDFLSAGATAGLSSSVFQAGTAGQASSGTQTILSAASGCQMQEDRAFGNGYRRDIPL